MLIYCGKCGMKFTDKPDVNAAQQFKEHGCARAVKEEK